MENYSLKRIFKSLCIGLSISYDLTLLNSKIRMVCPIEGIDITSENVINLTYEEIQIVQQEFKKRIVGNISEQETQNFCPSVVVKQEAKAIAYFERNNESKYFKIVEYLQKLRTEGKVVYKDLGCGKYNVIMPYFDIQVEMNFPPDVIISDDSENFIDWDETKVSEKGVTRGKLQSNQCKKYLEQKESEGQKMLFMSEFEILIQGLYPEGTEEEQILAFMLATGFCRQMWLADKGGDNRQRVVVCSINGGNRDFMYMLYDETPCGLVFGKFIK